MLAILHAPSSLLGWLGDFSDCLRERCFLFNRPWAGVDGLQQGDCLLLGGDRCKLEFFLKGDEVFLNAALPWHASPYLMV